MTKEKNEEEEEEGEREEENTIPSFFFAFLSRCLFDSNEIVIVKVIKGQYIY
jgi:uncharacterized membrane protein YadS